MNDAYDKIYRLLDKSLKEEAYSLAKELGLSEKEWEKILTDHFWDWHTEH